ncbi:MAG: threonine--tRNA ligase [Elusimicrobia bacterium RIFCSPLOWO2_01_FULL_59_12]|nr:MAG: threonine--tRNA ligase [Elusimicrobia bacterium RIFCSPLOWO2_01_FULL_59_12]
MSAPAVVNTKSEEYLNNLRHSTAHVMAQAVQELFPGTKLTIGPPIEDGFYYDFDSSHRFVPDDLEKIEKRMRQIAEGNHPFKMSAHSSEEAREFWGKRGEKYKVELIDDFNQPTVTYCSHDTFVDLCRGGHVESTKDIRHFKLLRVAGAYWRGDEKREQLQRIYGTAWSRKDELAAYLVRLEEAKKRDHRELGPKLGLFTILPDTIGPGLIFWLAKGATVRRIVEEYLRELLQKNGYQFVVTPHIARADLWKTSGHWDFYRENMFSPMKIDDQEYLLKPMNCPGHIQIYKHELHSYRELPIRITEMGTVYRYERSGVMHGLLRVRGFTQDDAHIFCRPDQIESEVTNVLDLTLAVLKTFGFTEYAVRLSTRPEKYVGTLENWEKAETALKRALEAKQLAYEVDPGEGVFYGPKIDLKIRDCLGRTWQCSTVQVDFNLPERFDVGYRGDDGKEQRAIMVHRALLGSVERFLGILIEHYAGAFPVWLAPVQVKILTITQEQDAYARNAAESLRALGFRVETDLRNEKIGLKIREGTLQKAPYLAVVGKQEVDAGTLAVRRRSGEDAGKLTLNAFADLLQKETAGRI